MLDTCKKREDRRLRRNTLQRCFKASRVLFQINAETLTPLEAFPYLGRTIAYNNSYWAALYLNILKACRRWGMIARVLESMGTTVQAWG